MNRPLNADSPEVNRLLLAMGGADRIRSVRTMLRETWTWRRTGPGPLHAHDRTVTHRAEGGRIRIETLPVEPEAAGRSPRLLVIPPSTSETARAVLRDARIEPRNLLAHLHERAATITATAPDQCIEIALSEERVTFTFDGATGLCTHRLDLGAGVETAYFDWRFVSGIKTPFLEIDETVPARGTRLERILIGIAYDLPLPGRLFG